MAKYQSRYHSQLGFLTKDLQDQLTPSIEDIAGGVITDVENGKITDPVKPKKKSKKSRPPPDFQPQQDEGKPVRIASKKKVPIGARGTAQGGRYQYQVQDDGSIKEVRSGRITSPPTRKTKS